MTPFVYELLSAQHAVIAAMVSARFDPQRFEEKLAVARASMRVAAGPDTDGKAFDQAIDHYLAMFRSGDPNTSA